MELYYEQENGVNYKISCFYEFLITFYESTYFSASNLEREVNVIMEADQNLLEP